MRDQRGRLKASLDCLTQLFNAAVLGGHANMSTSARCAYEVNEMGKRGGWLLAKNAINAAFFWEDNHCEQALQGDVEWCEDLLQRVEDKTQDSIDD